MTRYDDALAKLDEAIQELVAAYSEQENTPMMLNKWYLSGQCVLINEQSSHWYFGEMSKDCPLSDQLGLLDYSATTIRARIAED